MAPKVKAQTGKRFASGEITRIMSDWVTSNLDADSQITRDAGRTRARARALRRDNPYFRRFLAELAANVIGAEGIRLKMRVKRANVGRYANKPDEDTSRMIEAAWADFSGRGKFDATRQFSRAQWSRLALQSIATAGEAGIRLVRGFPKNDFRFAVQGVEADHLDLDFNREPSRGIPRIRASVEVDRYGEPTAYHLLDRHPGRNQHHWEEDGGRTRLLAEGYRDISSDRTADSFLFPFMAEEFGQTRGISWATAAIGQLRQLGEYEQAAVVAARVGSSKMFFIKQSETAPTSEDEEEWEDGSTVMEVSPGGGHVLGPGQDLASWDPNDPNGNYPDFRKGILRGIAAGLLCNYNILANDLEGVNYSSIRQGVLSERELWSLIQVWWIDAVEAPIFRAWLEMAILSGELPLNMSEFKRYCCPEFEGRRWDWVDPQKDIRASREAIQAGLSSTQREARKRGVDIGRIAEEQREDAALAAGADDQIELGFASEFLPGADPVPEVPEEPKKPGDE